MLSTHILPVKWYSILRARKLKEGPKDKLRPSGISAGTLLEASSLPPKFQMTCQGKERPQWSTGKPRSILFYIIVFFILFSILVSLMGFDFLIPQASKAVFCITHSIIPGFYSFSLWFSEVGGGRREPEGPSLHLPCWSHQGRTTGVPPPCPHPAFTPHPGTLSRHWQWHRAGTHGPLDPHYTVRKLEPRTGCSVSSEPRSPKS